MIHFLFLLTASLHLAVSLYLSVFLNRSVSPLLFPIFSFPNVYIFILNIDI
jgi:hypothetical protein